MKTTIKYTAKVKGILIMFLLANSVLNAQDTINFRNGGKIIGKVTEITVDLVKYKKLENLSGPTYSNTKNEISDIFYKNGTHESFSFQKPVQLQAPKKEEYLVVQKKYPELKAFGTTKFIYDRDIVSNREMHEILLNVNDPKITSHIKSAQKQAKGQYIGFGFFPCAIVGMFLVSESNFQHLDDSILSGALVGAMGVACFATSITLKVKRNKNEAAALKLYQQNY